MIVSERVLRAGADLFGYDWATLTPIEHGGAPDGAVYNEPGSADGDQNNRAYIVKFIPISEAQLPAVREKIAFVDYLRAGGVNVPDLVRSNGGNLLEVVEVDGAKYAVTRMVKAPGRTVDFNTDWGPPFWERWGRIIGQIHRLTQTYDGGEHIVTWEQEHAFFGSLVKEDAAITAKWNHLADQLRELPQPRDAFGLIHNDAHVFNFLVDGDTVTVLDFDVCARHWFAQDIAIPWFHVLWETSRFRSPEKLRAFAREFSQFWLAGYRAENTLAAEWLERLPLFARFRQFLFFIGTWKFEGKHMANVRAALLNDAPLPGFDAVTL